MPRFRRLLGALDLRLQFLNARIGALERFVLEQCGLHQSVGGVRRLPCAVRDQALGIGVPRHGFELG